MVADALHWLHWVAASLLTLKEASTSALQPESVLVSVWPDQHFHSMYMHLSSAVHTWCHTRAHHQLQTSMAHVSTPVWSSVCLSQTTTSKHKTRTYKSAHILTWEAAPFWLWISLLADFLCWLNAISTSWSWQVLLFTAGYGCYPGGPFPLVYVLPAGFPTCASACSHSTG